MLAATTKLIIEFYDPAINGEDSHGRTLDQVLAWPDESLELRHNFIQFLFPLPERSRIIYNAPLITREVFDAFRSRPELQDRLRQAYDRMLKFYGFERVEDENNPASFNIVHAEHWKRAFNNWATPWDHNHARLSRILRCLRVLGLEAEADALFTALEEVDHDFELGKAIEFWERAALEPLYEPPNPNDRTIPWLREWYKEQEALKAEEAAKKAQESAGAEEKEGVSAEETDARNPQS